MKNTTFCDITPCSLVEMYQRFGETYGIHLQIRRVNNTEKWIQRGGKDMVPVNAGSRFL
jgi:putative component of membrane protein insertase Oxa1/YidC/SpoIIIJ protein YidD